MSVTDLVPASTAGVRAAARNSFRAYLEGEGTDEEAVLDKIAGDAAGDLLCLVMDKYAIFLAFDEGTRAAPLGKNSVLVYFSHIKNFMLDEFPSLEQVTARRIKKIGLIVGKYCANRGSELTNRAPPCTKENLGSLVLHLYTHASTPRDYGDAALLCVMWYVFGRGSDIECLLKTQLAVYPGGCLFLGFRRRKTASEHGLSLVPDARSIATCPIHALAIAVVMQPAPSKFLLDHLPQRPAPRHPDPKSPPLPDLLISAEVAKHGKTCRGIAPGRSGGAGTLSGSAASPLTKYINRLLVASAGWSGVGITPGLTAHSFRRGGAQHANADARLSPQWILERGAWGLTHLSQGFNYIFNTSKQDQQVARSLAGRHPDTVEGLPTLKPLENVAATKVQGLQFQLFRSSVGVAEGCNLSQGVVDLFTASIIQHYGEMITFGRDTPYSRHIEQVMSDAGISHREMLRWGLTIADAAEIPAVANATLQRAHEAALAQKNEEIVQLRDQVSDLAARLADLELESPSAGIGTSTAPASATTRPAAAACRRATAKSLSAVWFDWHIGQPWSTSKKRDRKRYHDAKLTVAYMKLFLPAGFQLGEAGTNAKAGVVKTGVAAESGILQYLRALGLNNSAYGTVIKALKKHHKEGKLDSRIEHYRKLLQSGRAVDLTPPHARPELMPVAKDKQAEQTLRAED